MSKKILITGANGRIGSALVKYIDNLNKPYSLYLADLKITEERGIKIDVSDFDSCKVACQNIDTVIHLAGVASPDAPFEQVLPVNIVGTYNIFQAALESGVKRVIYASSAQTIEGYPLDIQINSNMPVRPKNLYGVSKVFGEALASYYVYEKNMESIAIRIGAFEYPHEWDQLDSRDLSAWTEPDDLCSLIINSIEADLSDNPLVIAHGISDNRFKRLDLSETKKLLDYNPTSDAFEKWNIDFVKESKAKV